jgi:hypothetical protein
MQRRRRVALRELWPEAIDNLASAGAGRHVARGGAGRAGRARTG